MRLHLKQKAQTRQLMTFAQQQTMRVLQMPQLELAAFIQEEIEQNPLLEYSCNPPPLAKYTDSMEKFVVAKPSLREYLLRQAREQFSKGDFEIAKDLIEQLDERGYLSETTLNEEQERILNVLQTFDPPGVCARNLKESFLNQLRGRANPEEEEIIRRYFHDFLKGRFTYLQKELGCSRSKLQKYLRLMSRLCVRPSAQFLEEYSCPKIADLKVKKIEEEWRIELNDEEIPLIQIRNDIPDLLAQSNLEERETVQIWVQRAQWLSRTLSLRKEYLTQIGMLLLRTQHAYFSQEGEIMPLPLNELAKKLEIHPSTAWRAIAHKIVASPRGMTPMQLFFSKKAKREPIKKFVCAWIEEEDRSRPFTDAELVEKLREQGIMCTRRTIAQYRSRWKLRSSRRRHQV